jgi:hypothetical protein
MFFQLRARTMLRPAALIGLISLASIALAARAVSQNVTLISFTAISLSGQPEIYVDWETATEFDTVGFFVMRSDFALGPYARVSDFIPHEGDTVIGAQYDWLDETTILGQTYFYRLEEITAHQISIFYGPIAVTAGSPIPPVFHYIYLPLVARSN